MSLSPLSWSSLSSLQSERVAVLLRSVDCRLVVAPRSVTSTDISTRGWLTGTASTTDNSLSWPSAVACGLSITCLSPSDGWSARNRCTSAVRSSSAAGCRISPPALDERSALTVSCALTQAFEGTGATNDWECLVKTDSLFWCCCRIFVSWYAL